MPVALEADFADDRWLAAWPQALADIEQISGHILRAHGLEVDQGGVEISFLFTNDEQVRTLNCEYRGKNRPTNVLSFPSGESLEARLRQAGGPPLMLGDIALAFETTLREAGEKSLTLKDHASHLVIHGILHLLGFDHQDDGEAEAMEAKEIAFCRDFGIANPYEA